MVNAIGIAVRVNDPYKDLRALLYIKACYLYGVPSFIFPVSEIDTYLQSGYMNAFRWTANGLERFKTDTPRFCEYYASLKPLQDSNPQWFQWIINNTILTDEFGMTKERLQREMLMSPLCQYAIPTFPIRKYQELIRMLPTVPNALLKPADGSLGVGIMRLITKNNTVQYLTMDTSGEFSEEVFNDYRSSLSKNYQTFLLEPCINILSKDERATDFRVQVSLNEHAQWEIGFSCARIGGNNIASNFERGGSLTTPELAIASFDVENVEEKVREMHWLALEVANLVQKRSKSAVSCLGIDICIDRDSKQLYVIEANSKPGGRIISLFHLAEIRAGYFKYLLST